MIQYCSSKHQQRYSTSNPGLLSNSLTYLVVRRDAYNFSTFLTAL